MRSKDDRNDRQPHRIAKVNYYPRMLGFASSFIAILLLDHERDLGLVALSLAALSFLVYPQLAYLHAKYAPQSKTAEQRNLLFDSVLLGVWSAGLGFNLWITFSLLVSTLLNNAINGGPPRLAIAAGCFAGGSLLWILLMGLDFEPGAGPLVTGFVITSSLLYFVGVGVTYFDQNKRLAKAHLDIAHKNRVFETLLKLSMLTNRATAVRVLIRNAVNALSELYPGHAFGIVLFDTNRRNLARHAEFSDIPVDTQLKTIQKLGRNHIDPERQQTIHLEREARSLIALPMYRRLKQCHGYLLISDENQSTRHEDVQLFVDQVGAALENRLLNAELKKAAETDGLTGLFNRAYLEEELEQAIRKKEELGAMNFSIVMIDVIGLKEVNDVHGHEAGDLYIKTLAKGLASQARSTDIVARYGGDEFIVLCHDCREESASRAVARIREKISAERCRLALRDGTTIDLEVRLSLGVAGSDQHPASDVLAKADERMYADKEAYYRDHERYR